MRIARLLLALVLPFSACGIFAFAQTSGQGQSACPAEAAKTARPCIEKPRIDKIDPPNWWARLPEPMLLVYGERLKDAKFAVSGREVTIARTQASDNGHWAFVWLRTANAAPQTLTITARNEHGEATASYTLAARAANENGHSGFSSADAMYLVMTDRFADGNPANNRPDYAKDAYNRAAPRGWHGGDFAGIEEHIDYLKQLGITTLWTTPVVSNGAMPEAYHGYAAVDLYATDPHLGTAAEYQHLSAALHARGIKLVMDYVPNHLGVQHPWIADPPAPEWFHGTLAQHTHSEGDFRNLVDPHAAPRDSINLTHGWFTDQMPDLNQENPLVSQYLIQNAMWWIETAGLDGLRIDTFPYVGRAFWHDLHAELHTVYPRLTTVGEVMSPDAEITSFFAGGEAHDGIDTGLDTPFDYPLYFALRHVLADDKPMTELAHVLSQDALYPHPERLVLFEGNHDTMRFLTAVHGSVPRLKLALGLVTTLRGMPELYSGDEIAMMGGEDPDNRHDFPGGFAGDAHNAFLTVGRSATENEVFHWTASLLALRKTHAALRGGIEQNLLATDDIFAFSRTETTQGCKAGEATDRLLIVVNKSAQAKSAEIPLVGTALANCTRLETIDTTTPAQTKDDATTLRINMPAESLTIFAVR